MAFIAIANYKLNFFGNSRLLPVSLVMITALAFMMGLYFSNMSALFKIGGMITCFMGVAMMPWKLLANHRTFIFGWLGGYAAVLGPVAGIMICDYFIIRRKQLLVDDLYLRGSRYEYADGFNWRAIAALVVGSGVALIGLVVSPVRFLYDYSWFVGFIVAFTAYFMLMPKTGLAASAAR